MKILDRWRDSLAKPYNNIMHSLNLIHSYPLTFAATSNMYDNKLNENY